jgi:spermidine synthase
MPPSPSSGSFPSEADGPAAAREATLSEAAAAARRAPGLLPLALLYGCSGVTGLAFEVLWARMLSLQFGVSIFGVVVTVAAFMAGLGLGSLLAVRWLGQVRRPLFAFAALEGGVAVYALCLPWLFRWADAGLTAFAPHAGLAAWHALQAAALLLLLLAPATAMGAAFFAILRASGEPRALGRLYGLNACGAAVGALLPLWLLPAFGWTFAVETVAVVALAVSLSAAALAVRLSPAESRSAGGPAARGALPAASLAAYALVGAAAMLLEVGWTRLYGMVLLRTEYVLAIILAVYLLGIGAGSLLARRLTHPRWLGVMPAVAAASGIATLWLLPAVAGWSREHDFSSLAAALWAQGGVLAAVTLPATLALGAWLPLLAARAGGDIVHGAALYGVNSLGAALGALAGGFLLIPGLGTPATVVAGSLVLFMAGMAWSPSRLPWLALAALLPFAWPVLEFPTVAALLDGPHRDDRDLYRYEDAMTITHVIERPDGQRWLLTDLQRMDASTEQAAVELQKDQARLPLLLHPAPRSILFLGLGTGISAAGSLGYPGLERTAVELSRGAIEAAGRWFAPANGGVMEHTKVLWDDARRMLRTGDQRYDVIVGDVFHPDLVGRSALLSVQQFERARSRLAPGGVFVQWLALNQFDRDSLVVVLRSFSQAFPNAVLFMDGFRLALVGFELPASELPARMQAVARGAHPAEATGGEGRWTWMGRYWGRVSAGDGPVQDEWRPRIEFGLPRARYRGDMDLGRLLSWLLDRRPAAHEAARSLGLDGAEAQAMERAYIATDLGVRSWLADLEGDGGRADRLIQFAHQANPDDRWIGFSLADSMLAARARAGELGIDERQALERILRIRPDHAETLRALWRLEREAGNEAAAQAYFQRLAAVSPLDRAVVGHRATAAPRRLSRGEN